MPALYRPKLIRSKHAVNSKRQNHAEHPAITCQSFQNRLLWSVNRLQNLFTSSSLCCSLASDRRQRKKPNEIPEHLPTTPLPLPSPYPDAMAIGNAGSRSGG